MEGNSTLRWRKTKSDRRISTCGSHNWKMTEWKIQKDRKITHRKMTEKAHPENEGMENARQKMIEKSHPGKRQKIHT